MQHSGNQFPVKTLKCHKNMHSDNVRQKCVTAGSSLNESWHFPFGFVWGWNEKLISDIVISIGHYQPQSTVLLFALRNLTLVDSQQRINTVHTRCSQLPRSHWLGSTGQCFLSLSAEVMTDMNACVVSDNWQWSRAPPCVPDTRGSRYFVVVVSSWR